MYCQLKYYTRTLLCLLLCKAKSTQLLFIPGVFYLVTPIWGPLVASGIEFLVLITAQNNSCILKHVSCSMQQYSKPTSVLGHDLRGSMTPWSHRMWIYLGLTNSCANIVCKKTFLTSFYSTGLLFSETISHYFFYFGGGGGWVESFFVVCSKNLKNIIQGEKSLTVIFSYLVSF